MMALCLRERRGPELLRGHAGEAGVRLCLHRPQPCCVATRPVLPQQRLRKVPMGAAAPVVCLHGVCHPVVGEPENSGKGMPFGSSGWSWWSRGERFSFGELGFSQGISFGEVISGF